MFYSNIEHLSMEQILLSSFVLASPTYVILASFAFLYLIWQKKKNILKNILCRTKSLEHKEEENGIRQEKNNTTDRARHCPLFINRRQNQSYYSSSEIPLLPSL